MSRGLLPIVALSVIASCGRSNLFPPSVGGTGGTGGTGGSDGGPSTTSCGDFDVASSILTVAIDGTDLRQPNLVLVDGVNGTSCLVYAQSSPPGVAGAITQVSCFPAEGAWPPAIPAGVNAHAENSQGPLSAISILAASQVSPPSRSFALLYGDAQGAGTTNFLSPATGYGDMATPEAFQIDQGDPLFVVAAPSLDQGAVLAGISVGTGQGAKEEPYPSLSVTLEVTGEATNLFSIMCATTPIAADAVGTGDGWLVGVAHSGPAVWFEKCPAEAGGIGPATTLDFGSLGPQRAWSPVVNPVTTARPVTHIRMAARSDGAWAIFHVDGATSLEGARVLPATRAVETFAIGVASSAVDTFQVAPLGDGFVLATTNSDTGSGDEIQLDHFDAGGAVSWSRTLAADGVLDGPVSLLSSSDGRALLVAWSELPASASDHRLRVARLDCLPKP